MKRLQKAVDTRDCRGSESQLGAWQLIRVPHPHPTLEELSVLLGEGHRVDVVEAAAVAKGLADALLAPGVQGQPLDEDLAVVEPVGWPTGGGVPPRLNEESGTTHLHLAQTNCLLRLIRNSGCSKRAKKSSGLCLDTLAMFG